MSLSIVHSRAQVGVEAPAVTVEVHLANGLPSLTMVGLPEAAVKALMLRAAARAVVVADGSKLGEVHLGRIAPIDAFDVLVTDAAAPAPLVAELEASGLAVHLARDPKVDP